MEPEPQSASLIEVKAPPISSGKCFVRSRLRVRPYPRAQAEQKLNLRFEGLEPSQFHADGVIFFTMTALDPPRGFEDVWYAQESDSIIESFTPQKVQHMKRCAAVILLADPEVPAQVKRSRTFVELFNTTEDSDDDMPMLLWMAHSPDPEACDCDRLDSAVRQVMSSGIDDVIYGWPEGSELIVAVRSRLSKKRRFAHEVERTRQERAEMRLYGEFLEASMNRAVWQYFRQRSGANAVIPDMDSSYGLQEEFNGLQRLDLLGSGSFGAVYLLRGPGPEASGQVVKCIKKTMEMFDPKVLQRIQREAQIMTMLSNEYPHPNIIKFYGMHHNQTHLIFRMEDGGSVNLFRRLLAREEDDNKGHISSSKVIMLLLQTFRAIDHMHSSCHFAHLDIKPENICIKESAEDITCKLVDFGETMVIKPLDKCRGPRGTFPYAAPEAYDSNFRPFPADIWSLGVLLFEILCGTNVLDRALHLSDHVKQLPTCSNNAEQMSTMQAKMLKMRFISDHFEKEGAAGSLVQKYARPELCPVVEQLGSMFDRMVRTCAVSRMSSLEVLQVAEAALPLQNSQGSAGE